MIRTKEVIPTSLDHAMLATRVLASLNQIENPHPSPLIDGAMEDAVRFLKCIIDGKRYTAGREVNENSYECSLAYGEAIRAVELLPTPNASSAKADIIAFVVACLQSAEAISRKQKVDKDSVDELMAFFRLVRDVTLRLDRKPIELVSAPE
jgi:hypothetical protein